MIVFDLKCSAGHGFEAWFKDGATFDKQVAAATVQCPECGDTAVEKALMAPKVGKGSAARQARMEAQVKGMLRTMRKAVETNCDYVGPRFAEEARKIHYGQTEARGIYGEASDTEAKSLREEGIEFGRLPWVPREDA